MSLHLNFHSSVVVDILVVVWYSYPSIRQMWRQTSWASSSRMYQQPLWDWWTREQTHLLWDISYFLQEHHGNLFLYVFPVFRITCHLTRLFIEFSFAASLRLCLAWLRKKEKKEANWTWLGLKIKSPRFIPSVTVEIKIFHVFLLVWALGLN